MICSISEQTSFCLSRDLQIQENLLEEAAAEVEVAADLEEAALAVAAEAEALAADLEVAAEAEGRLLVDLAAGDEEEAAALVAEEEASEAEAGSKPLILRCKGSLVPYV